MTTVNALRVFVVDDQTLVREAIAHRLAAEHGFEVVGTASNADDAISQVGRVQPDIILLDIDMPGRSCFDAAVVMKAKSPRAKLVFLSGAWNRNYLEKALALRSSGYLTKSDAPDQVAASLRRVADGEVIFSGELRDQVVIGLNGPELAKVEQPLVSVLTKREQELLRHLAHGLSRREIAEKAGISVNTVAVHTSNIMSKLNIHDRVELTRLAIREGLAKP